MKNQQGYEIQPINKHFSLWTVGHNPLNLDEPGSGVTNHVHQKIQP